MYAQVHYLGYRLNFISKKYFLCDPQYLIGIFHVGEGLSTLRSELKNQKKQVRNLKKKSLWSRSLEEVSKQYCFISFSWEIIKSAYLSFFFFS